MIPLLLAVRFGARRLWIPFPLFIVWLLLLPLCLLLLPLFVIACRINRIPAGGALLGAWALLRGLRGVGVAIAHPDATFALRLI